MQNEPEILENQDLDIKNLLSIRYQGPQEGVQAHMAKAESFAKEHNLKLRGVPISANYGIHPDTKDIAMEVYYPIDRQFTSDDPDITFKPRLYLHNCLRITHIGDPKNLQETNNYLNNYIKDKKLAPISVGFSVSGMNVNPQDLENFEMDIYISISPNVI